MRTINVEVCELGMALENRMYFNSKKEEKWILRNFEYFFSSEGVVFNCRLIVDSEGDLCITEINGQKPESGVEAFYTIEEIGHFELEYIAKELMIKYGFLPSFDFIERNAKYISICAGDDSLVYKGKDYFEIFLYEESIFLLNTSDNCAEHVINYEQIPYDIVEKFDLEDIKNIEFASAGESIYLDIFTKKGLISLDKEISCEINHATRDFYRVIKQYLV